MSIGDNPFILIARIKVKKGYVDEYFDAAREVDELVQKTEPGMLFHNFDIDPDDDHSFTWSEVYADSQAFIDHASNPPVHSYVQKHLKIGTGFDIEVYGNISREAIQTIESLGVPFKHFKSSSVGFVRAEYFKIK